MSDTLRERTHVTLLRARAAIRDRGSKPMRIAWATDIHLDSADDDAIDAFSNGVVAMDADAVFLGGDIADGPKLVARWLDELAIRLARPIYFVLGNHDHFGSDIATVRGTVASLSSPWLSWLPEVGPVPLTESTVLVGNGCWGDARAGDLLASQVLLNDYFLIQDLQNVGGDGDPIGVWQKHRPALVRKLRQLGDESASTLAPQLDRALREFEHTIVLTHVPPFKEACLYGGRVPEDGLLPGFVCKAVGDLLLDLAAKHCTRSLTVLCGHTHHGSEVRMAPNLLIRVASARYGRPQSRRIDVG